MAGETTTLDIAKPDTLMDTGLQDPFARVAELNELGFRTDILFSLAVLEGTDGLDIPIPDYALQEPWVEVALGTKPQTEATFDAITEAPKNEHEFATMRLG